MMKNNNVLLGLFLLLGLPLANSFCSQVDRPPLTSLRAEKTSSAEEALRLLERSKALREEIEQEEAARRTTTPNTKQAQSKVTSPATSKWSVPLKQDENGPEYRLYVDIGREEGTWMEPRWGASGRRIEFTLDVQFQPTQLANEEARKKMVQDNKSGASSPVYTVESAPLARLRSGFDEMKCEGGAFRIDKNDRQRLGQSDTLRFYVTVEGTPERGSSYGDLYVPEGALYFSIPCFGSVQQLSSKGEMPVTVRQVGWHTGWRREESRIVGVFRAVPIEDARRKDGF